MTDISISDANFAEIMLAVGVPILDGSDFELTESEIKILCILPTIREFWTWFPLKEEADYSIGTSFDIEFPDTETFGAIDIRLNTAAYGATGVTRNPFVDEVNYRPGYRGLYGTGYDYNTFQSDVYAKLERQAIINKNKAFRVQINESERKVTGYSNAVGILTVIWAKYSNSFEDIPYNRIQEVIWLAQSKLLRVLGMIRGQLDADTGADFNYDMFIKRADDLEEKVMTKWKAFTKPVILRG